MCSASQVRAARAQGEQHPGAPVLRQNATQVAHTGGKSFEEMASRLHSDWVGSELDRIADAALDGGVEMDERTDAAHAEIRAILVEQGVLKR